MPSAYDYFNKTTSGASFLTITTAQVLDIVEAVAGRVTEVDARTQTLWPQIEIVDTGETSTREIADHVDLIAETERGASVSVQVLAGVAPEDAQFAFELRGSEGTPQLTGRHMAGVQVGDLSLTASVDFEAPDAPVATGTGPTAADFWAGASINVGEVYASLARDMASGRFDTPGFAHAAHNSRLVEAVASAANQGVRRSRGSPTTKRLGTPNASSTRHHRLGGSRATGAEQHFTGRSNEPGVCAWRNAVVAVVPVPVRSGYSLKAVNSIYSL